LKIRTFLLSLLLVILSTVVRWHVKSRTGLLKIDGIRFLYIAEAYAQKGWEEGIRHDQHPLHPFLLGLLTGGGPEAEARAAWTCSLLASLALFPLYAITRICAGEPAALISGLFFAFHPHLARYSAGLLSDPTFLTVSLFALWAMTRGLTEASAAQPTADGRGPTWWWALAGCFGGLAYLTRQEGLVLLVVAAASLWAEGHRSKHWRTALLRGTTLVLLMTATLLPYLWGLHQTYGRWQMSPKKALYVSWKEPIAVLSAGAVAGTLYGLMRWISRPGLKAIVLLIAGTVAAAVAPPITTVRLTETFLQKWPEITHPLLFALGAIGLLHGRRSGAIPHPCKSLLASLSLGMLAVGAILYLRVGYLERRHLLLAAIPLWIGSGAGTVALADQLRKRWRGCTPLLLTGIVLLFLGAQTFKPVKAEEKDLWPQTVGEALRERYGPNRTVLVQQQNRWRPPYSRTATRILYYARWRTLPFNQAEGPGSPEEAIRQWRPDFVLWDLQRARNESRGEIILDFAKRPPPHCAPVPFSDHPDMAPLKLYRVQTDLIPVESP
jgi:4-amino-4-deoxy-L-arabinose transferase-like glycosyltransferase